MGERECRLQWVPNYIVQESVSLQPSVVDRCSRGLRMYENQSVEFLGLRPDGMELCGGQILSVHASGNGEAPHPKLFHSLFHLLDGKGRVLQGHAAQAHETVRVTRTKCSDFLVLNLDDLA